MECDEKLSIFTLMKQNAIQLGTLNYEANDFNNDPTFD